MNLESNLPSSLYKEGGVTHVIAGMTPMSPRQLAKAVYGTANGDGIWSPISLISIVDVRIQDKAHRILGLIGACSWREPCALSFEEIGRAVNCSARQAIRHVNSLIDLGYVKAKKVGNRRNTYSVTAIASKAPITQPETKESAPAKQQVRCPECRKNRPMLLKAGWCRSCGWQRKVRVIVREEMEKTA